MPQWLFWTLLTLVSWGVWAVLFRRIEGQLSESQCQIVSTLGVLPVLAILWPSANMAASGWFTVGSAFAFGAGLLSCLGNIACYHAIRHAKASTVVPLTAMSPVVTILLAIPILKEPVNAIQWGGIVISLIAILLFNVQADAPADGRRVVSPWLLLALAAVVLWGVTGLVQKISTNYVSAEASAFCFLMAFIPFAGALLISNSLPRGVDKKTWLLAILLGFTLALGNVTILLAFARGGKASIISPLAGLYPVVSIPLAILWLHERVKAREALGIVLALTAVVMLSYQTQPEPPQDPTPVTDIST